MAVQTPSWASAADGRGEPPVSAVKLWLESGLWTEETYFALPDTNHIIELSDGKLIIPELPTITHQELVQALFFALYSWFRQVRVGRFIIAPYPIHLRKGKIREPDIVFYRPEHEVRISHQFGGPPDLAVEILSPSTRITDLTEKREEYAQAGVTEYWIGHPDERWLEVYILDDGKYRLVAKYSPGQTLVSPLLSGFSVTLDELFAV